MKRERKTFYLLRILLSLYLENFKLEKNIFVHSAVYIVVSFFKKKFYYKTLII